MTLHESEMWMGGQRLDERSTLPIGYHFCPTDEELVSHFLTSKYLYRNLDFDAIAEVDFNQCEPWDLQSHAKTNGNAFYFFSIRDRKYPTGMRTNRATRSGYWKSTGTDRKVRMTGTADVVGMKKTLVFYKGRAPAGERTHWVMHEYRRVGEPNRPHHQELAVCRVFIKEITSGSKTIAAQPNDRISYNAGYSAGDHSGPFLPSLRSLQPSDSIGYKGGCCSAGNHSSSFPTLQSLEPSCQSHSQLNAYIGEATSQSGMRPSNSALQMENDLSLGREETGMRGSNSTLNMENEMSLGGAFESLVAGWDEYPPTSPDL